jgi:ribokinase
LSPIPVGVSVPFVAMGRVIVVGSANVDLVWHGPRLPRPGETVTDGAFVQVLGGKGANQAAAAAALDADVYFVGCVGEDDGGRLVRADLEARGIDCRFLTVGTLPTGVALVVVDARGDNAIAVAPGANREVAPSTTADAIREVGRKGDVVVCSLELDVDAVVAAVAAARWQGASAIVNLAPARDLPVSAIEAFDAGVVLVVNEGEAERFGRPSMLAAHGADVIVTHGAFGAELHLAAGGFVEQAGFRVDTVDTTGAGDAFTGALAWALAAGQDLKAALPLGCAAGALATRAVGARSCLPSADEVLGLVSC